MNYNGIEIDMLSLGDADSIVVTMWENGVSTRVLIDGGRAGGAEKVKGLLLQQGSNHVHHVVCTHPHDDHGGGLVELLGDEDLTFGHAWLHLPWRHIDMAALNSARSRYGSKKVMKILNESLETQNEIAAVIDERKIPYDEPFEGKWIGFLKVLSPSQAYYEELLAKFTDLGKITLLESQTNAAEIDNLLEEILEATTPQSRSLMDDPKTEPENNSSTILAAYYDSSYYLFTADAGAEPLTSVKTYYPQLAGCKWMQIPHHGSRRNITLELIEHFRPSVAYVSAVGNNKHPRRAVVNAFKDQGTSVFSTHHPEPGNLWHHNGDVPLRPVYTSASQLWDQSK